MPADLFRLCRKEKLSLGFSRRLLPIFSAKFFYAAGGVDKFLLAGEKWMAVGADFQMQITNRGTCFERASTCAGNGADVILRMNALFQGGPPLVTILIFCNYKDTLLFA